MLLKRVPRMQRFDAGTEKSFHIALRMHHSDNMAGYNSCSMGRSTANQRIEMLWIIFLEERIYFCLEKSFQRLFNNTVPPSLGMHITMFSSDCIESP